MKEREGEREGERDRERERERGIKRERERKKQQEKEKEKERGVSVCRYMCLSPDLCQTRYQHRRQMHKEPVLCTALSPQE